MRKDWPVKAQPFEAVLFLSLAYKTFGRTQPRKAVLQLPPQNHPGALAGQLPILHSEDAIDKNVTHAFRGLIGLEGRSFFRECGGVKDSEIRPGSGAYRSPIPPS